MPDLSDSKDDREEFLDKEVFEMPGPHPVGLVQQVSGTSQQSQPASQESQPAERRAI